MRSLFLPPQPLLWLYYSRKERDCTNYLKTSEAKSGLWDYVYQHTFRLSPQTIKAAQSIIIHSLKNNFGSMDAMIAATAECERNRERDIIVITSDKALKQCLNKCGIPIWDPFSSST